jgi:hypothetical protein
MATNQIRDMRRAATRFTVEAPAVLWPDPANPLRSLRTVTKNISRTGFWLHGELDQGVGAVIRFELRLPSPIGGVTGCMLRGAGTLVRHESLGGRRLGFAAKIEHYTIYPLPPPAAE